MDAPVIGAAAAFPVAPDIRHQYIITFLQIDPGIRDAHGPVLIQPMEQDDGIVASCWIFDIRALEPGPVFGMDLYPLPAVFPFQAMDGIQIVPMIFDGQQFVPGLGEQLLVSRIPSIDTCSKKQQQGQENQVFDEVPKESHSFFLPFFDAYNTEYTS